MDQIHFIIFNAPTGSDMPLYNMVIQQSPKIEYIEYAVQTLDIALAYVGGFIALIVPFSYYIIAWYQEFSYKRSLLSHSFTASKHASQDQALVADGEDQPQDPDNKNAELTEQLQRQVSYNVSLCDWFKSLCCASLCCCTKAGKEADTDYKVYSEGYNRLCKETDMLTMVKEKRVSDFLANVELRKGQKQLVNYAKHYYLDEKHLELAEHEEEN